MTYGLSNLLVYGSGPFNILGRFRDFSHKYLGTFGDMLDCMMCTSTNIGFVLSILDFFIFHNIMFTPFNILFNDTNLWYLIIPFDGFVTSGVVWLIHTVQETLELSNNEK